MFRGLFGPAGGSLHGLSPAQIMPQDGVQELGFLSRRRCVKRYGGPWPKSRVPGSCTSRSISKKPAKNSKAEGMRPSAHWMSFFRPFDPGSPYLPAKDSAALVANVFTFL